VPLFLTAITRFLFKRVLGAREGSRGTVVTKRGAAVGEAACPFSRGEAFTDMGDTAIPSGSRKASTWRQGAAPKVRKALRNTGSQTCIHCVAWDWRMLNKRPCSRCVGCCLR
jgi:hypothetical protein